MAKKRSKRELKAGARQKTPARKIARSLKRTEGATRQKAFSLGISSGKSATLHTKSGRIIFTSPAKSATTRASWDKAFEE
jgi:hypothetical protein